MQLGRPVGPAYPPFIIAAIDCTGTKRIEEVLTALDAAADAKFDAVKIATLPTSWYPRIFQRAEDRGLFVLPSVGDERTVERLDWLGAHAFEIFFDWADLDLVTAAARTGKPLLLSVANASDVQLAEVVARARAEGAASVAIVQRVVAGVDALAGLARHGTVLGISSRPAAPLLLREAVARGARIVEVRLRARRLVELQNFVRDGERTWAALGSSHEGWTTN
ncbi:MAG TPA: N-acetylneuraminate synthase family protein [Kofleriaceae bacterium]|jgi:N-acetylneuraminate synthase